ncbi:MAG: hypothetical protein PVG39_04805 [Desulfobacteraceae bacterium]|jgi:hypothetical protein
MFKHISPSKINPSKEDVGQAKDILSGKYIVKYLRHIPTVGLARLPHPHENGPEWYYKRVICSGVPYGCMIAFQKDGKLFVGWSKRMEDSRLVETHELHEAFRDLLKEAQNTGEDSEDYDTKFNTFVSNLTALMTRAEAKDVEVSFSKKTGKLMAVLRGLEETLEVSDKRITSSVSNIVPAEVSRGLRSFIQQAEKTFGMKVSNVKNV